MPIQFNSAEAAALARLETQVETAFSAGVESPPGIKIQAPVDGYSNPIYVNGKDRTSFYRPKIKAPFKLLAAALMRAVESWNGVELGGTWSNSGGVFDTAAYYRDFLGHVHLRGVVHGGTIVPLPFTGGLLFQLPAGYRPLKTKLFRGETVAVDSGGNVLVVAGVNTLVSLDGITFLAEQ